MGNEDGKEISFFPLPTPYSLLPFRFLFAFCRLTLNVPAPQGYRIERQIGNDRPGRGDHLQAEPIVSRRLTAVDNNGAERVIRDAVDRRLSEEHPRIADDRERLQGAGLERHKARRAAFCVKQPALGSPVPPVLDVEHEGTGPAVMDDSAQALECLERRIKDHERGGAGTDVIAPTDANAHIIDVYRNVVQRRAGRERPADASAARGRRLRDRLGSGQDGRQGECHRRRPRDVARTLVISLVDSEA